MHGKIWYNIHCALYDKIMQHFLFFFLNCNFLEKV